MCLTPSPGTFWPPNQQTHGEALLGKGAGLSKGVRAGQSRACLEVGLAEPEGEKLCLGSHGRWVWFLESHKCCPKALGLVPESYRE